MRCPECGHRHKATFGMVCHSCDYRFVLSPKDKPYIADGRFHAIVRSASANDTYYFTRNQFLSRYRRWHQKRLRTHDIVFVIATLTVVFGIWFFKTISIPPIRISAYWTVLVLTVAGMTGVYLLLVRTFAAAVDDKLILSLLDNWPYPIDKLITQPALREPPPAWQETDIYDYGVERILFVEHGRMVDLLVLNGAHADHRALIIAERGYPEYLVPIAHKLLAENPDLPVFALHDPSPRGLAMVERLRRSERFPLADRPISDLGLSPEAHSSR